MCIVQVSGVAVKGNASPVAPRCMARIFVVVCRKDTRARGTRSTGQSEGTKHRAQPTRIKVAYRFVSHIPIAYEALARC